MLYRVCMARVFGYYTYACTMCGMFTDALQGSAPMYSAYAWFNARLQQARGEMQRAKDAIQMQRAKHAIQCMLCRRVGRHTCVHTSVPHAHMVYTRCSMHKSRVSFASAFGHHRRTHMLH